jgi:hypothetical protein
MVTGVPGAPVPGEDEAAGEQRIRSKRAVFQALSPEKYPNVVALAGVMTGAPEDETAYFDLGMSMLIAGIRGVRPATAITTS